MSEPTVERRFHGSVVLVILQLRRAARSTTEAGFVAAKEMLMLTEEQEAFIRRCMALDEQLQNGQKPDEPITIDLVNELQKCARRLSSSDPC